MGDRSTPLQNVVPTMKEIKCERKNSMGLSLALNAKFTTEAIDNSKELITEGIKMALTVAVSDRLTAATADGR